MSKYSTFVENTIIHKRYKYSDKIIDGRQYYVYRITDIKSNTYYYGSRIKQHEDILEDFWSYCTSSCKKKDIMANTDNYTVKIVRIFDNSVDMYMYESFLHNYFNVKENNLFWNKTNQQPWGFDRTNSINTIEHRMKISISQKGIPKPNSGKHLFNLDGTLKKNIYDKMVSSQRKNPSMLGKTQSTHQKEIASKTHKGKIISERQIKLTLESEGYRNKKSPSEGLKEYYRNNKSHTQKSYKIYNDKREEIFHITNKSLRNFCKDNNLPYTAFYKSFIEKGSPVYNTPKAFTRSKIKGWDIYKDWFCLEVVL